MFVAFVGHSRNASYARGLTRLALDNLARLVGALLLLRRRRTIVATVTIPLSSSRDIVRILSSLEGSKAGCLQVLHLFASARGDTRVKRGRTHELVALTLLSLVATVDTRNITHCSILRPSLTKNFAL